MREELKTEIMDWLKNEYDRRGRNFTFKSQYIEQDVGIDRRSIGKMLVDTKNTGGPLELISAPATRSYKWRTVFE